MFTPKYLLLSVFTYSFLIISCNNKKTLFEKDETNEKEKNNTLFVFVGEKIEVKELPQDEGSWDGKYWAKYKIIQRVYGNYEMDTIGFIAYDHKGVPGFINYKNSLLFVSEIKGKYYHEKYQYYGVFKTKDNKWAGTYSIQDFGQDGKRNGIASPQQIDFAENISFPLSSVKKEEIYCWFPEPYYKIKGDSAYAVYGSYIEDLFRIKKEGILAARGLFEDKNLDDKIDVLETTMAEIVESPSKKRLAFLSFWKSFVPAFRKIDFQKRTSFVLDTVIINDTICTPDKLITKGLFDNDMSLSIQDSIEPLLLPTKIPDSIVKFSYFKNSVRKTKYGFLFFETETIKKQVKSMQTIVTIDFIETKQGFKLYGCRQYEKSICW